MKRPKKIRKGDIFVSDLGTMRIILSLTPFCYDTTYIFNNYVNDFSAWDFFDFEFNNYRISEYYLGNIMDIKPKGKF